MIRASKLASQMDLQLNKLRLTRGYRTCVSTLQRLYWRLTAFSHCHIITCLIF